MYQIIFNEISAAEIAALPKELQLDLLAEFGCLPENLDDLDPEAVRVELYANGVNATAPERVEMKRVRQPAGATNSYAYRAGVLAARPATDYTARLIPHRDGVAVPLEAARILWQQ